MAKKKTTGQSGGISAKELATRARYPIGLLFQVSTLAGCIAYLVFTIQGTSDVAGVLYRSVIIFLGCAVLLGIVLAVVVNILHRITIKEIQDSIHRARMEALEIQKQAEAEAQAAPAPTQLPQGTPPVQVEAEKVQ
jgi:hypothetical protein